MHCSPSGFLYLVARIMMGAVPRYEDSALTHVMCRFTVGTALSYTECWLLFREAVSCVHRFLAVVMDPAVYDIVSSATA